MVDIHEAFEVRVRGNWASSGGRGRRRAEERRRVKSFVMPIDSGVAMWSRELGMLEGYTEVQLLIKKRRPVCFLYCEPHRTQLMLNEHSVTCRCAQLAGYHLGEVRLLGSVEIVVGRWELFLLHFC